MRRVVIKRLWVDHYLQRWVGNDPIEVFSVGTLVGGLFCYDGNWVGKRYRFSHKPFQYQQLPQGSFEIVAEVSR